MPAAPAQRLRVVTASDRAKPDLQIAFEPFYVIARELLPLFRRHWKELAIYKHAIPLDPNWDLMLQQSVQGFLHCLTVRDDGDLVGYIFTVIGPHPHYKSSRFALVDMFYLDPRYRRGLTGLKMFRENEKHCRRLDCVRIDASEKLHWLNQHDRRVRVLFKRLGYKAIEVVYSKLLRED